MRSLGSSRISRTSPRNWWVARRRRSRVCGKAIRLRIPLRRSCTLGTVAGSLEPRGSYTPRRVREQRAYRLAVVGSTAGVVGVVGIVLAVAGVFSALLPVLALLIAALCAVGFMRTV